MNATTAVAVGYSGHIMRSTDAGLTWQPAGSSATIDLLHVAFDGLGNGTAATSTNGATDRLHTSDGGQTWGPIYGPNQFESVDYAPVGAAATAIGVGFGGDVETSTDGGVTWTHRSGGAHPLLRGITFGSATVALAVGDGGTVLRSVDGGGTWTPVAAPASTAMYDVAFTSAQVAIAVGDESSIWRSTDAGVTWSVINHVHLAWPFAAVHFTSATHGVIVGSGEIDYTDDAGLTWHAGATGSAPLVQSVAFGSPLVGVAVGDGLAPNAFGFANGAIVRTTDGGATWSSIALPNSIDLQAAAFIDANTVVAVGLNGELRSTDAGQTWVALPSIAEWTGVAFTSATEGIAISSSGFVGRTHDGGLTWPDGEYMDGGELDSLVVSPSGKVFMTTSGGAIYRDDAP